MRYLLVLDMDLLAFDEELDLQPINHLVAGWRAACVWIRLISCTVAGGNG
jgi:hypothetical protein